MLIITESAEAVNADRKGNYAEINVWDKWTDKFICPKCRFSFLKQEMKRCPACKRLVVWANEIDDENGEY